MCVSQLRSIAFCCLATGIFGFPNDEAAEIALRTVRKWLETGDNATKVDAIIFCIFLPRDLDLYHSFAPVFFPIEAVRRRLRRGVGGSGDAADAAMIVT